MMDDWQDWYFLSMAHIQDGQHDEWDSASPYQSINSMSTDYTSYLWVRNTANVAFLIIIVSFIHIQLNLYILLIRKMSKQEVYSTSRLGNHPIKPCHATNRYKDIAINQSIQIYPTKLSEQKLRDHSGQLFGSICYKLKQLQNTPLLLYNSSSY